MPLTRNYEPPGTSHEQIRQTALEEHAALD
jgi:hypothetical protein